MRRNSRVIQAVRYAAGLFAALVLGIAPLGFSLPPVARADSNPVDLELGGEGATYWSFAGIKPTDSGTRTVELHNAGTQDGFVTIWVSDITNNEGLNPEAETGDTAEPGELGDYLLLDVTGDNLTSNLNLPATIGSLPQSADDADYIDVMPLKAGETANLQWHWELPAETGNEVQGDSILFSINYLLRECKITDVSGVVTAEGVFTDNVTAESDTGKATMNISAGIKGKTADNQSLSDIWIIEIDKQPLPAPESSKTISINYEFGPSGATFDQPIGITLSYNPGGIPEGGTEEELSVAVWDKATGQWVQLNDYTVNVDDNTITAYITHFSRYVVMSHLPPPPPSTFAGGRDETAGTTVPPPESPATTGASLEVSMLDSQSTVEIGEDGTLAEALTLADTAGSFVIDIDSGTRITGPGGEILSRIELTRTGRALDVPDGMVLVSPTYELIGYTGDMETVPVTFDPPARLSIGYDPRNLPENSFQPFVATYAAEQGLLRLNPPPGALVETGRAQALVSNETLFVVAAELAPPPPPLPARFEATDLTINPTQSFVGETVQITVTIANRGESEGSTELHLVIDGIVRAIEEATLTPLSSETLTFEISNLAAGSHQVKIAGLSGDFTVKRMEVTVEESEFNWLLLDTIVGSVIVIGAVVLYFLIMRARRARLAMAEKEEITFKDE